MAWWEGACPAARGVSIIAEGSSLRTPSAARKRKNCLSADNRRAAVRGARVARLGLRRTLPPPDGQDVQRLHRTAKALHIDWPAEQLYPDFIRSLDPANPRHAAMVLASTRLLRGSGYVGRHGKDLLVANDRWYRGINLKTGPDGSVYVIDWYDKQACHHRDPKIWDRTNGRIYKICFRGAKWEAVDLRKKTIPTGPQ